MRPPTLHGLIDRRIFVNFRVDPAALTRLLPAPFRPKLVHGVGMAGICLIRLTEMRACFLPKVLGVASENAAHRIAVEWDEGGEVREGVFVPRRDTSSHLHSLAGGVLFPGAFHCASFDVAEERERYRIGVRSDDGEVVIALDARAVAAWPGTSAFGSLEEASAFFEKGARGYSPGARCGRFDAIDLRAFRWKVEPLSVDRVVSSYFADPRRFGRDDVELDSALLMRGIEHEWRALPGALGE
jgi:hypothetical protein